MGVEIGGTADDLSDVMAVFLDATEPTGSGPATLRASHLPTGAGQPLGAITVGMTDGPVNVQVQGETLVVTGSNHALLEFAGVFNVEGHAPGRVGTYSWTPGSATIAEQSLSLTIMLYDRGAPAPGERPTTATVVAWILIVIGSLAALGVAAAIAMRDQPEVRKALRENALPPTLQYVMMTLSVLMHVVAGFALLNRQAWSRWLYVGWGTIGSIIGLIAAQDKAGVAPSVVALIVLSFFMYRPNVTQWLNTKPAKRA